MYRLSESQTRLFFVFLKKQTILLNVSPWLREITNTVGLHGPWGGAGKSRYSGVSMPAVLSSGPASAAVHSLPSP
jgi:hypothetical protein